MDQIIHSSFSINRIAFLMFLKSDLVFTEKTGGRDEL